jgi:hypothetical protein
LPQQSSAIAVKAVYRSKGHSSGGFVIEVCDPGAVITQAEARRRRGAW